MGMTNGRAILISGLLLIASPGMFITGTARATAGPTNDGPTQENALEAEKELGQAMRTNDADGFCRLLDPDWAVVNGIGGFDESVGVRDRVCAAIRRPLLRERPTRWTLRMPECASTATSQS